MTSRTRRNAADTLTCFRLAIQALTPPGCVLLAIQSSQTAATTRYTNTMLFLQISKHRHISANTFISKAIVYVPKGSPMHRYNVDICISKCETKRSMFKGRAKIIVLCVPNCGSLLLVWWRKILNGFVFKFTRPLSQKGAFIKIYYTRIQNYFRMKK